MVISWDDNPLAQGAGGGGHLDILSQAMSESSYSLLTTTLPSYFEQKKKIHVSWKQNFS